MISSSNNEFEDEGSDNEEPLHVHDLPQIYTHPSYSILHSTLTSLALTPTTFSSPFPPSSIKPRSKPTAISPIGLPTYLTQIISSPLFWLSPPHREEIYTLASTRLAERAGRSAAPAMTRLFTINRDISIELHEPSLTGDNLGLKTWSSSLMLARRLGDLNLPAATRVLELGAGTGLVGIAAACLWRCMDVVVSDLPEITPNLSENVARNADLLSRFSTSVSTRTLDWGDEADTPGTDDERFTVILAADPLYSAEHPRLLVGAVERWLARTGDARFVVEMPLREGYQGEREDMATRLRGVGLVVRWQGEEVGFDDWEGRDGERVEGRYAWSVWGWGGDAEK